MTLWRRTITLTTGCQNWSPTPLARKVIDSAVCLAIDLADFAKFPGHIITARSELREVLFLAPPACGFFVCV